MKKTKKIISFLSSLLIGVVICFMLCAIYFPDETSKTIGYRPYVVLTDSMEPTIPTYSLVFSKLIDEKETIKPNSIVTFHAERGGEDVLITHYYRKQQVGNDGNTYYRTQPEGEKDNYDPYETSRSDIIGTYAFHIPFIGKYFLFLKSEFAYIFYLELLVIFLINKTIRARWEEKEDEEESKCKIEVIQSSFMKKEDFLALHIYKIQGVIKNNLWFPRKKIKVDITCYHGEEICYENKNYLVSKKYLHHHKTIDFELTVHLEKEIDRVEIKVMNYHI